MWILPKNVRGSWHLRTAQGPNTSAPKTVDDPPYSLGNGAVAANHRLVDDCRGFFVTEYDHNPWTGNLNNQAVFHHGGTPYQRWPFLDGRTHSRPPKFPSSVSFSQATMVFDHFLKIYRNYIPTTSPLLSGNQPWLAGKSTIHGAFSGTICGFDTPKIHIQKHHCVKTIVNHMGCYWIYGVMGFHLHSIYV